MAKRYLLQTMFLMGSAAGALCVPTAAVAQDTSISVGSMDLAKALDAIATQTGVKIVYDPDAVPGKTSAVVSGARDAKSAVAAAIRGTGLGMSIGPGGAITVGNDIIVTATRDEAETSFRVDGAQSSNRSGKSLKELPQGTEVITSALIKQQQALTLNDALRNSAGVVNSIGNVQGLNTFRIRGFNSSALQNGIAVSAGNGPGATSIDTVERIEVLKGPSAILAGADNLGGIVNIVDKRPSADPILDISAQYGTFDDKKFVIDASSALNASKTISARVIGSAGGAARAYGGYRGRQEKVFAPSLRYKTSSSDIIIGLNTTEAFAPFENFRILDPATNKTFLSTGGRIGPRGLGFNVNTTRYYASAEQRVTPWFTIVGRATYVKSHFDGKVYAPLGFFNPGTPFQLFSLVQGFRTDQTTRSADVYGRFTFNTGSLKHIITAGYNYTQNKYQGYDQNPNDVTFTSFDIRANNSNLPLPGDAIIPFSKNTSKQNGLYIQDFIDFGRLHVLAAVRRNTYDFAGRTSSQPKITTTNPNFGAVLDITKSISLYGVYARGYTVNYSLTCTGDILPPILSENIEGGLKSDFFEKRFTVNVSAYQLKQNNVPITDRSCAVFNRFTPQGGLVTRGVELTASGEIVSGLDINASYSFADYKYQHPGPSVGTLPPLQYRNKYTLYLSYNVLTGPLKGLGIAGGVFGNGRTYVDSFGKIFLPPQAQLDANLSYRIGRAKFNLGVKNITDRKLNAPSSVSTYIPLLGPRRVMGTVTYSFF